MSSPTVSRARQQGGGGRQFPVGARRRYAPVVDGGCGCRPRRPRLLLLLSLPSFLKLGGGGGAKAATVRRGASSSSTSTASFSSSSGAATHSTTGYSSSSAYSSDYYHHCYGGAAAATKTKQQQQEVQKAAVASPARARAPAPGGKKQQARQKQKKKRHDASNNKMMAEEEEDVGVGVAVEKESSDPRADFRDSMVQMIVEMGLCDWDGLRCMLRRLLALNAPRHHAAILTAFAEVCAQIVAAPASPLQPSPSPSRSPAAYGQYRRR